MRRAAVAAAAALALVLGVWQTGHGAYIKAKAVVAQILLAEAWDRALAGETAPKPWAWADTWPVARLEVPRLHAGAIVLHSASGQALAFGPGHMSETALPGEPGLSVIAAHRDTHFRFLRDIEPGDDIRVTTADGVTHVFEVTGTRIVRADASGLDANGPGHRLALVTCYPFDALAVGGPLRFVVLAEEV